MTQKIAHTHPERARDRRDRGQCGIDLAGLDPRHMLLRKPRLSGQHGLRQPRSSTRRGGVPHRTARSLALPPVGPGALDQRPWEG